MEKFDFHSMPSAYLSENKNAKELRKHLIKKHIMISEYHQGNLENVFFSDENIDLINKQLILTVFKKSKNQFVIPNQSKESLIIVMRYVFIEYSRNLPYDINNQIKELNCIVVGEILPNIITNITQRIDYLKEIDCPKKQLLDLPINVNKTKNLKSVASIIFD
jgi:hypothetical protein